MPPDERLIGGRYRLLEPLGSGGMGVVYRAWDRLAGQVVALKRVMSLHQASTGSTRPVQSAYADMLRLALANEFQILASLRHPHIIGVLDYGFEPEAPLESGSLGQEAGRQPYFTMEYLAGAQTFLEAGAGQSIAARVELIGQVLQALAYLHRRGIVHRDLKPGNVLVADGQARVLDFGLSAAREQARGSAGTAAYMAPEVLRGSPGTEAADLYAVGVLAYELLAGRHPFGTSTSTPLIQAVLSAPLDLSALPPPAGLAQVVGRLMARDPDARYASADDCLAALSQAMGQPPPQESVTIRESYLQAARFVGRDAELGTLSDALDRALAGHGSVWLVAGESGVGKSRLLNELRIRALVQGAAVVRGHAVREGGLAYHMWREPLRRLVLTADLDDLDAGILTPIVPDIATLLGRPIPEVPGLEGEAGQRRLLNAVVRVCSRQPAPVLLILEDLHWAAESLDVLRPLHTAVQDRPLLVVGSYRDDEAPAVPAAVPGAGLIRLERLSAPNIAELSASMLGEGGRQHDILALLQRESEGNAFFLVEVVRALAEEAGRLSDVGRLTLPDSVFPQGIQTIVHRRLEQVPAGAQALLRLAAVAGRELDLSVLAPGTAQPGEPPDGEAALQEWLTACANAAVLEVADGRWRFSHDKLRDGLLAALEPAGRAGLHQQVAQAVERAYPDDPDQAATLAHHWAAAGDAERERHYRGLAGEHAAERFAQAEALAHLSRALELTDDQDLAGRYRLLLARAKVYGQQGKTEARLNDIAQLQALADALEADLAPDGPSPRRAQVALLRASHAVHTGDYAAALPDLEAALQLAADPEMEAEVCLNWGRVLWRQGKPEAARQKLEHALGLARGSRGAPLPHLEAATITVLGLVAWSQGEYAAARAHFEQAIQTATDIGDRLHAGVALNNLGLVCLNQNDYAEAGTCFGRNLTIMRELGVRVNEGMALNNLGLVAMNVGDGAAARDYFRQALAIHIETNSRQGQADGLHNLGIVSDTLGDYGAARNYLERALATYRDMGNRAGECLALSNLGILVHHLGDDEGSLALSRQALANARQIGERGQEGFILTNVGHALTGLGRLAEARPAYEASLALRRELGERVWIADTLAGLARLALLEGDLPAALAHVEDILALTKTETLAGADEPMRAYLTCVQVLRAAGDPRQRAVLAAAHELLLQQAARIGDDQVRRSFLENVPVHREILAEAGRSE